MATSVIHLHKSESQFPLYNIAILGTTGVGKTSLLWRFVHHEFIERTIFDKHTSTVALKCGKKVNLELWDTAGLEKHVPLQSFFTQSEYKKADAIIVVYQITRPASYTEMKEILQRSFSVNDYRYPEVLPVILFVGTKSDLVDQYLYDEEQARVKKEYIKDDFGKKMKYLGPIECSAKTGKNVDKVFSDLAEELYHQSSSKLKHSKVNYVPVTQNCTC